MDSRQLQTLLAVADTGSFAAAAEVVNLTASAVSQQMVALETELGTQIFDRSRRPPTLNAKGAEVVQSARAILQILSETCAAISGGRVSGTLNLGTLRTASMHLVPQALAEMRRSYPEMAFNLRVGISEDLMNDVVAGRLDAAVVAEHVGVPPTLQWTPFLHEPLLLVAPPDCAGVPAEQLIAARSFIRYHTNVPLAKQIETEIARLGITPTEVAVVNTMPSVIGCVHAGLGVAVVPQIALHDPAASGLAWQVFGTPPIHRRLGIVRRITSSRSEVLSGLHGALAARSRALGVGVPDES